jgi:hypothetical protein
MTGNRITLIVIVFILFAVLPGFGQDALLGIVHLGDKPVQFCDASGQMGDSDRPLKTNKFFRVNADDFDPLPISFRWDMKAAWQPLLDAAGQKVVIDPKKKNTLQLIVVNQKNEISLEILDNPAADGPRILVVNGTAKKLDGFSLTKTPQGPAVVSADGLEAKSHSPLLTFAAGDLFVFYKPTGNPKQLFLSKEYKWPLQPAAFKFESNRYYRIELNGEDAHLSITDVTDDPYL